MHLFLSGERAAARTKTPNANTRPAIMSEHVNGLQQKRLQCVKRNKLGISLNQKDRQRSDPPKHDLQHVGQQRDGALILGRRVIAGMNWFGRDSSSS